MATRDPVLLVELRVLEGPNLYLTRPAIKVTVAVPGWLEASSSRAASLAERVELPGWKRDLDPGEPRTEHRRRFVARVAAHVTRSLTVATGSRVAVRARPGDALPEVVVAFAWRHRTLAEALGEEVVRLLRSTLTGRRGFGESVRAAAARLSGIDPGPSPTVLVPRIPVLMVTGTNGKTTTVRLLTHLLETAGLRVAYTSTDGVFLGGDLVEEGDYSGPAGAEMALSQPGVEACVLEVARGGILLKGIGVAHNDAAVVTNISADHLGLLGIRTLDQLAEVKATITRITRPDGWAVLNADDPRVIAMRRHASGRPFLISMDPDHPAIRSVISAGGRALAPLDGALTLFTPGPAVRALVPLEDVPVTLAGIATQYVQNAMAAAAGALGVGVSLDDVAAGLRSFEPNPNRNPGRANLFEVDGRIVIVDYAHNEAGMEGLVAIARGLRRRGARIWMVYCAAGDRTDEIMHALGYVAARGADRVGVAELPKYLRGREPEDVVARLRAGAVDGGARRVPTFPDEVRAVRWMLRGSRPGDVLAITALSQRREIVELLEGKRGRRVGAKRCRELVRRARAA